MKKMKKLTKKSIRLLALMLCFATTIPQAMAYYTVTGDDPNMWGTAWNVNQSNNMTQYSDDGNYYYLIKTVSIGNLNSDTRYQFQIVENGNNWYNSGFWYGYPRNDSGTYTCVFSMTANDHSYKATGPFTSLTVAGNQTDALGTSWDPSNTNNDMVSTDGGITYTLTKENVVCTAGPYECKIVCNHSWDSDNRNIYKSYPDQNKTYNISQTGTFDITYTFNTITQMVTVTTTVPVTYNVVGASALLGGTDWDNAQPMTAAGDGTYTWTRSGFHLDMGNYDLKVLDSEGNWYGDVNGDNVTVKATESGTYTLTVTLNPSTNIVEATWDRTATDPENTYNIYVRYTGDENLSNAYMHAWNALSDFDEWPGIAFSSMNTQEINGHTYYVYTINSTAPSIGLLFNESGVEKTRDLTATPGNNYFTYSGGNIVEGPHSQPDAQTVFYVVGQDTNIFPNGWNTGSGTAMTYNGDHTYTWTSGQVQLAYGTEYEYKVHGNDNSWYPEGAANATFSVGLTGTYTVTITYDQNGNVVNAVTSLVNAGNIYIEGSAGLGLNWSPVPTHLMTVDSQTGIYSYTYEVTETGTYNFVFANGQGNDAEDWDNFNGNFRIGPTAGSQAINLDGQWHETQMAGGDNGSYRIKVDPGTLTISFNPNDMTFKVDGNAEHYTYTFYVLPDNPDVTPYLYLWGVNDIHYTSAYPGNALTETEVLEDGNTWYKKTVSITTDFINALVSAGGDHADDTKTKDITYIDPGTYYIYWTTDRNTAADILYDENNQPVYRYNHYEMYNDPPKHPGGDLYIHGDYTYEGSHYSYSPSNAAKMKYDANTGTYYLNNVTLNNNITFCFSDLLSDSWINPDRHRYGNGAAEGYTENPNGTNYLEVNDTRINRNLPLDLWSDINGEYRMFTSGIFNVLVNPEQHWVKLIKTDHMMLTPMNIYLEQTSNVKIDNVQNPGTTYTAQMFDNGYWPLSAYNAADLGETWDPNGDNHYGVEFIGDTTTVDGKKWWHWEVTASICEFFFTRTNDREPAQSTVIRRKSGAQWITWDEADGVTTMTDHTREYFEAAANALPSNVVVMEGHYYVYFINTVGWKNVYCYAWDNGVDDQGRPTNFYADGYSRVMSQWPGRPCERIGIDPVTGYEVWRYDFGTIAGTDAPNGGIIFNDGNQDQTSQSKEQTGDFEYINGGVYDYLGLFDGSYTLNNLIRTAAKDVRYTVSNALVGVYYDEDAVTTVEYTDINGEPASDTVRGALYAKDMNQYGEKSYKPDASYSDYVYDICYANKVPGGSQVMQKKTTYDQSNWIKLVISPNYDGGSALPVADDKRPNLKEFEGCIIPAGTLELFMTDNTNPTGHVMNITKGDPMAYEPNVYVPYSFNDSYVFTYTHQDWPHEEYEGVYLTRPVVTWNITEEGVVRGGTVEHKPDESKLYKMFYVAPKPQEVAYVTWIVYDNDNLDNAYPGYDHDIYTAFTPVATRLPQDGGCFYAPSNWKRSTPISSSVYNEVQYLSYEEWENYYHQQISDVSNGYMQLGGVKVNWSLFDEKKVGMPWWQIFQPGQAYKLKAIVRYAFDNEGNVCYEPSNGYIDWEKPESQDTNGAVRSAPRREGGNGQGNYANMYFTSDYDMEDSKFIIFPIEASPDPASGSSMGNVTTVREIAVNRTVTGVYYYNLMGVMSDKPFDGINIVVTTYSDGSRTSKKVLR
jgi:hypothetical protein